MVKSAKISDNLTKNLRNIQKLGILYSRNRSVSLVNNDVERMCGMFQVGDFIVYGSTGVCEVESIGTLDIPGMSKDRVYYTLRPCYEQRSTTI